MLFNKKDVVTQFYPTFLKEDRSFLRKVNEMLNYAKNHIYITCPWITLGEELVVPLENAIDNNPNLELYLITKLEKGDVFNRIQQLDDIEKWMDVLNRQMYVKYNNKIHSKMIIVDNNEVILGSSNLTGSGLGSSRDYEGKPQIESNVYTNDPDVVANASRFFLKIWDHETSIDYNDKNEHVLSCKSHNLSGIFQKYKNDLYKILKTEDLTFSSDGTITFTGDLAFSDENKAYIIGKNRTDIAVKFVGDTWNLRSPKLGKTVTVSGKLTDVNGLCEFKIVDKEDDLDNYIKLGHLKSGLSQINVIGIITDIIQINLSKNNTSKGFLKLVKIEDKTGNITLELWPKDDIKENIKKGSVIEVTNGYTKIFRKELRLTLKYNGKIEVLRGN